MPSQSKCYFLRNTHKLLKGTLSMDLVQHMLLIIKINLYQPEKCWGCFYIDVELSIFPDIFLHHSPTKLFVQHLCYQTKEKKVYWHFYWCHEAIIDQAYFINLKVVPNYRSCSFLCFNPLILKSNCLLIPGCEINFFSESHLTPKFFKVVANSKEVGCQFQRQTKPFSYAVSVLHRPSKIKLGKRSLTCYKVDTRMDDIQPSSSPKSRMASSHWSRCMCCILEPNLTRKVAMDLSLQIISILHIS